MSRIGWTEQMSVGVPGIDRQHQRLVDLFNGLEDELVRGSASRVVRSLFAELASYGRYHFGTEVNLLRIDDYPGLAGHVDAHDEFTARVADLESLLQREGGESAAVEASRFLRGWILRHIVVADRLAFANRRHRAGLEGMAAADGPAAERGGDREAVVGAAAAAGAPERTSELLSTLDVSTVDVDSK